MKDYVRKAIRNILHANIDVHSRRLIDEFPVDVVSCIFKLQSHCANMNFVEESRYDRIYHQVTHKGGQSETNHVKRFQNTQGISVSVGNSYSGDQLIHIFLDNFHQGEKYTAHIARHQATIRREEKYTDQKYLSITFLQTD